jgi:L-rhamnose mutarotase
MFLTPILIRGNRRDALDKVNADLIYFDRRCFNRQRCAMIAENHEIAAFRMTLNPGMADEYRRRHDALWPELRDELLAAGVIDYRIFIDPETHHLFAMMERRKDHTLAALRDAPVMRRWWAMMADIMATQPDNAPMEVALAPMFALTKG